MDQNNIILVLLLIAVLVAFYAIYLGMENSKRIKKISLELNDTLKLLDESTRIRQGQPPEPEHPAPERNTDELDEYPSLEEINNHNFEGEHMQNQANEQPLEENLKNQIDNLDNLSEEQLLMLEKRLENEDELIELRNISNLEEINRQNENFFGEDFPGNDHVSQTEENQDLESGGNHEEENAEEENAEEENAEEENNEEEEENNEEDEENDEGEEAHEEATVSSHGEDKYPVLANLTEDVLNQYNCEELREICKREELRTRGRKSELVERILKKKEALA